MQGITFCDNSNFMVLNQYMICFVRRLIHAIVTKVRLVHIIIELNQKKEVLERSWTAADGSFQGRN